MRKTPPSTAYRRSDFKPFATSFRSEAKEGFVRVSMSSSYGTWYQFVPVGVSKNDLPKRLFIGAWYSKGGHESPSPLVEENHICSNQC